MLKEAGSMHDKVPKQRKPSEEVARINSYLKSFGEISELRYEGVDASRRKMAAGEDIVDAKERKILIYEVLKRQLRGRKEGGIAMAKSLYGITESIFTSGDVAEYIDAAYANEIGDGDIWSKLQVLGMLSVVFHVHELKGGEWDGSTDILLKFYRADSKLMLAVNADLKNKIDKNFNAYFGEAEKDYRSNGNFLNFEVTRMIEVLDATTSNEERERVVGPYMKLMADIMSLVLVKVYDEEDLREYVRSGFKEIRELPETIKSVLRSRDITANQRLGIW